MLCQKRGPQVRDWPSGAKAVCTSKPGCLPLGQPPFGINDAECRRALGIPSPQGDTRATRRHDRWIDDAIATASPKLFGHAMGCGHPAIVNIVAPLRRLNARRHAKFGANDIAGQVRQFGVFENKLHDGGGMLDKALVIFRPSGRKFTRRIKANHPHRIPAPAKPRSPCARQGAMRPARHISTPQDHGIAL